jgi:hypothetical protein
MRKNIYEIFDEFVVAKTKQEKIEVLAKNWTPTLKLVLQLAYRPEVQWKYKAYPAGYKIPDTKPGISHSSLDMELKRLYMFQDGNETAEKLQPHKRESLLLSLLDSLEPREADIVIGIFKKDLGVKGLTFKFIKDNIPGVLD